MAQNVLAFTLYDYEKEGREIPTASDINDIDVAEDEFVNYITRDTIEYRKRHNNKAVKKTLTIPQWLNEELLPRASTSRRCFRTHCGTTWISEQAGHSKA